ncbi:alpha/beta hydrolase [Solitalea koreensis]|uniref:Acetyl esterase/lipase n=1 Tax=Solitalea koreensis TaxID=543615 RepID=A0A521CBH7_9SPHI|nr:alpha/beta hydrolase [Solitalea koreensis]SMO56161.1 Acetyl esterase/lipase [Solitalea koreensis]
MNKFVLLFVLSFSCSLLSCKKDEVATGEGTFTAQTLLNVSYGTDKQQIIDIYLPKDRSIKNTKVIIFLHGGAWSDGDKLEYTLFLNYFSDHGFAVVNMNYRLAKDATDKFPTQMEDIRNVISFILSKTSEYNISSKIGLSGHSAGAHLALLYSYAYNQDKRVKAVAALAAPTDLTDVGIVKTTGTFTVEYFLGKTYQSAPDLWKDASPFWRVDAGSIPTILFHGEADSSVPIVQSEKLNTKLESFGVPHQLVNYPNANHIWLGADLSDTQVKEANWFNLYLN